MNKIELSLTVNGEVFHILSFEKLTLAHILHEKIGLSGTKVCCGIGVCKACTIAEVRSDGKLRRRLACITPVTGIHGKTFMTVEGLNGPDGLSALQKAFLKHFSFQCGYSTPGFLMGATILLDELTRSPILPSQIDEKIKESLGRHLCRCTGYVRYYRAIKEVITNHPDIYLLSNG